MENEITNVFSENSVVENEILSKLNSIDNSLTILTNSFVIIIGVLVAVFVCYLMYKIIDNFINY